jgi:ribose transport system substrate-binding protein
MVRAPRLIAVCGLALAACSSGGTPVDEKDRPVTVVVANTELNFAKEIGAGFSAGVAHVTPIPAVVAGPKIVDGAREVQIFNQILEGKTGGVSVMTLSPELFILPMSAAVERGVPLIAVDNLPMRGSGVNLFIGNDNTDLGRMLADQVIAKLPPDTTGDIVLGTSAPGTQVLDWRVEGMLTEFKRRLPKVRVLGPFDTKQEVAANHAAWNLLVQSNPKALAFVGTGDADGRNLADIRRKTRASWVAGAFDLDPLSLQAVADGDLLLVSPEHYVAGMIAGRLQAARSTSGKDLPRGWIKVPGLSVTPANIVQIMARQGTQGGRQAWFGPEIEDIFENLEEHLHPLSAVR